MDRKHKLVILVVSVLVVVSYVVDEVPQGEDAIVCSAIGMPISLSLVLGALAGLNVLGFSMALNLRKIEGSRGFGQNEDHDVANEVTVRLQGPRFPQRAFAHGAAKNVQRAGVDVGVGGGVAS